MAKKTRRSQQPERPPTAEEREIACGQELKEVLAKHNCSLIPEPFIRQGLIAARQRVIANP